MSSYYYGCFIQADIADALTQLRGLLEQSKKDVLDAASDIATAVDALSGPEVQASALIGTGDAQVRWTAVEAGPDGNLISLQYLYLGPNGILDRAASSYVVGTHIYCVLPVSAAGAISDTISTCLATWLSDPDVAVLVTGSVTGSGTGIAPAEPQTYLTGGQGQPLADATDAADQIAQVFGQKTHQDLLKSASIPVVESDEDARQYLQDQNQDYLIINGKLLLVEGTNLVGINALYRLNPTLNGVRSLLAVIKAASHPSYVATQNVETLSQEIVCGEPQTVALVTEVYRAINTTLSLVADTYASGSQSSINNYFFWSDAVESTRGAHDRIVGFGMPEVYCSDIISGVDPDQLSGSPVQAPSVYVIEDIDLLSSLGLSDDELLLLLAAQVDGIAIPGFDDRQKAVDDLTSNDQSVLDNGLTSKVKKPICAAQAVNPRKALADDDLAKELATRGKACARQSSNFNTGTPAFSGLDLPNMPTADLPISAAQIESSFGALSNVINTASSVFDAQLGAVMGATSGMLNKVTNLSSLTDNLLKNGLAKCLLGTGSSQTGLPDIPGLGPGGGSIASPSLSAPSLGGLPLPTSLLTDAMKALSTQLDETITDAFTSLMEMISLPLCQVQSMISSILGATTGGASNPCADGKSLDNSCPPAATQDIINASTDMASSLSGMQHLANEATTATTQQVTTTVQQFTGTVQKSVTETENTIDRGVKKVMEDIQKGLDAKIKMLDKLDAAVRSLMGDMRETKVSSDENATAQKGCHPPQLGLFTDAISAYL